jgi:hypothetical protein
VSICRPSCAGGEPMKGLAQNAPEAAPAIRRADAEPRASSSTTRPGGVGFAGSGIPVGACRRSRPDRNCRAWTRPMSRAVSTFDSHDPVSSGIFRN